MKAYLPLRQVLEALAGGGFSLAHHLPLDTMVTLDLGRLGVLNEADAPITLRAFVRRAKAWSYDRGLPTASISVIEKDRRGGLHAHIALHIPGLLLPLSANSLETCMRSEFINP